MGKPGQVYYPLSLDEVPKPSPKGTEVVIKIHAAALNHRDLFIRQHLYPGIAFGVPLLADGCGTVVAVGTDADPRWKGKRVVINPGLGWKDSVEGPEDKDGYKILGGTKTNANGTLQEYLCIDQGELEEAPEHLSSVEAAAFVLTGLTAWRAVVSSAVSIISSPAKTSSLRVLAVASPCSLWNLPKQQAPTSSSVVEVKRRSRKAVALGAKGGVNYKESGWDKKLFQMLPAGNKQLDAIVDGAGGDVVSVGAKLLKVTHAHVSCCWTS